MQTLKAQKLFIEGVELLWSKRGFRSHPQCIHLSRESWLPPPLITKMAMPSNVTQTPAQLRWELENDVQQASTSNADHYFRYDAEEQKAIQAAKPWATNPNYFKRCEWPVISIPGGRACATSPWTAAGQFRRRSPSLLPRHPTRLLGCRARISALALLKMAMHAKSGGSLEVMGVMQGKVQEGEFIVIDAFALPVEGTETRVNAQQEAYEYMVQVRPHPTIATGRPQAESTTTGLGAGGPLAALRCMLAWVCRWFWLALAAPGGLGALLISVHADALDGCSCLSLPLLPQFQEAMQASGRRENIVGWYHSHPGYGCWLSGIDVTTQMTNQRYQEPFLAVSRRAAAVAREPGVGGQQYHQGPAVPPGTRSRGRFTGTRGGPGCLQWVCSVAVTRAAPGALPGRGFEPGSHTLRDHGGVVAAVSCSLGPWPPVDGYLATGHACLGTGTSHGRGSVGCAAAQAETGVWAGRLGRGREGGGEGR